MLLLTRLYAWSLWINFLPFPISLFLWIVSFSFIPLLSLLFYCYLWDCSLLYLVVSKNYFPECKGK